MDKISDRKLFENFSNIKIPILGCRLDGIENITFDENNSEIIKNLVETLIKLKITYNDYPQIAEIHKNFNPKINELSIRKITFKKKKSNIKLKEIQNKIITRTDKNKNLKIKFEEIQKLLEELAILEENIQETNQKNDNLPYQSKLMIQNIVIELETRLLISVWPRLIRRSLQVLRNPPNKEITPYVTELGVRKTFDYFNQYTHFENLSLGSDDYQREHIMHVFRVYLLGLFLLGIDEKNPPKEGVAPKKEKVPPNFNQIQLSGESNFFNDEISKQALSDEDKKEIERRKLFTQGVKFAIWTIIALTHDLGYPLEKLKTINENVTRMAEFFEISELQPLRYEITEKWHSLMDILLNFISIDLINDKDTKEYKILLNHEIHSIFSKSYIRYNHGLISSLILYQNLPFFQESLSVNESKNDKIENFGKESNKPVEGNNLFKLSIRREILRSIASHSCEEYSIENLESFEGLLVICDELQEWNRPYAKDRYFRINNVVVLCEYVTSKIKIWYSMKYEDTDFFNCSKFKINTFLNRFRRFLVNNSDDKSIEMVIWKGIEGNKDPPQEEECKMFFDNLPENLEKALKEEMIRIFKQKDTTKFDSKDNKILGFLLLIGKKPFKDMKSTITNIKHEIIKEILEDEEITQEKRIKIEEDTEKKIKRLIGHPMLFMIMKGFDLKKIDISALNGYD